MLAFFVDLFTKFCVNQTWLETAVSNCWTFRCCYLIDRRINVSTRIRRTILVLFNRDEQKHSHYSRRKISIRIVWWFSLCLFIRFEIFEWWIVRWENVDWATMNKSISWRKNFNSILINRFQVWTSSEFIEICSKNSHFHDWKIQERPVFRTYPMKSIEKYSIIYLRSRSVKVLTDWINDLMHWFRRFQWNFDSILLIKQITNDFSNERYRNLLNKQFRSIWVHRWKWRIQLKWSTRFSNRFNWLNLSIFVLFR